METSASQSSVPVASYAPRPRRRSINWRIWIFAIAVLMIPAGIGYIYLSDALSGGIHNRGDYYEVDLKHLGFFEFDPLKGTSDSIPKEFRELDGQRVLLRGEMWSAESSQQGQDFQLVYSIAKCCFGGPPKVQERVFAHAPNEVQIYGGMVDVIGRIHVKVERDETGIVRSVYRLDVEHVKPI